jgi:hypothetical protein
MSDLRLGVIQGRPQGNIVVYDNLDMDDELLITFEDIGDWGGEDRYLSRDDMTKLRDHLTTLLEG